MLTYEVRSYAAPLGEGEHETVIAGSFPECAAFWRQHYLGTTAVLDHDIVPIRDGVAISWDDLTDDELLCASEEERP